MPPKVRIKDVAAAAGVSHQTVSRVINRHPNVKAEVRERVRHVIATLGYVPDLSARRMGGGRSFLIMAVNDRARTIENWQAGRGNDWVDQMLYGGMTECERLGYHLVFELVETETLEASRQLLTAITSLRPDGVILTPPHCDNPSLVALLKEQRIPCARVGHSEGGDIVDVYMDEESAAFDATAHLVAHGHSQIAFIAGAPNYGSSALRVNGFKRALRIAGLPESAGLVGAGDFHFDTTVNVMDEMLRSPQRPTAVIADSDEMAFATLHCANSHGLQVPDELSVISFEDTPGVRFSVPPLTAIRQPTAAMIAKACECLIEIAGGAPKCGHYKVPYELVLRSSTGPLVSA